MENLGKTTQLTIVRFVSIGVYLDGEDMGEILLPRVDVPDNCKEGDLLEVFVYRDSEDRLIATTQTPYAQVGECAFLEVAAVNDYGAFLEWGLLKDLFVPFGEQHQPMKENEWYVVYLYIDNTDRIAASSKLTRHILDHAEADEYTAGQEVDLIFTRRTDLGFEAVVNNKHFGMVFKSDALFDLRRGMRANGFIKEIRETGKIDLALQPVGKKAQKDLATQILADLEHAGGESSLTDKSSPDDIFAKYGVSKKVYKKAIGGLYRAKKIAIEPGKIKLV